MMAKGPSPVVVGDATEAAHIDVPQTAHTSDHTSPAAGHEQLAGGSHVSVDEQFGDESKKTQASCRDTPISREQPAIATEVVPKQKWAREDEQLPRSCCTKMYQLVINGDETNEKQQQTELCIKFGGWAVGGLCAGFTILGLLFSTYMIPGGFALLCIGMLVSQRIDNIPRAEPRRMFGSILGPGAAECLTWYGGWLAIIVGGVSLRYIAGVEWVARATYGMNSTELADAIACGREPVMIESRCFDDKRGAPIAPWLAFPGRLYLHCFPAIGALLLGVHQLLFERGTFRHILIGYISALCVIFASAGALVMTAHTTAGLHGILGFTILSFLWLFSLLKGIFAVRKKSDPNRIQKHKRWMIRHYALTFSAVTLRLWQRVLSKCFGNGRDGYLAVMWCSWVPNAIVAEVYLSFQINWPQGVRSD